MGDVLLKAKSRGMRLMIAAGGTGGHLYPGIALAQAFKRRVPEGHVSFVGTQRGLEKTVVQEEGYELHLIKIRGLVGVGFLKRILALLELPYSLYQSYRLLRDVRPSLVIGIGGYASGPIMLMAWVCRIPQVLVEPNAAVGLTNRFLAPFAKRIYLAFEMKTVIMRYFSLTPPTKRRRPVTIPITTAVPKSGSESIRNMMVPTVITGTRNPRVKFLR